MDLPLSLLDLATVHDGVTIGETLRASAATAQHAERLGYRRVWFAEHHNMPRITSSATSVLIGYVAANTSSIRVGAGGVMLPNHSPLTVAEQFGTLAELYPGRIDLGLGRAPGSDQQTMRALRRDPSAADTFPQDVLELQGYLAAESRMPGVTAVPGAGTNVPLYILGSSLFGARLAAALGLPYAFASHFAPQALLDAVAVYRREFQPSADHPTPHVIAGINVIAADDDGEADRQLTAARRRMVTVILGRGRRFTNDEADMILETPAGRQVADMLRYFAVGTPDAVVEELRRFARHADADELILAAQSDNQAARLRSLELIAEGTGLSSRLMTSASAEGA